MTDGSLSDSAAGSMMETKEHRDSISRAGPAPGALNKKSSSTSKLSDTGK